MNRTTKSSFWIGLFVLLSIGSFGCGSSVDDVQEAETEAIVAEAHKKVGMPNIVNFMERRHAKDLLELRDSERLTTYTYTVDMDGGLHFLCYSTGYGLPYSVQFTNPYRHQVKQEWGTRYHHTVPQPDPNGLFMPSGLSATWVMCLAPDGKIQPIYSEPELLVSPFELEAIDSYVLP